MDRRAQDRELVPTEPRDGVAGAHRGLEPLGDLDQEPIARAVPERVVDDLEAVEVEEEDRQRQLAVRASLQGDRQPIHEERPVRQPGEPVVQRLAREALGDRLGLEPRASLPIEPPREPREHGRLSFDHGLNRRCG